MIYLETARRLLWIAWRLKWQLAVAVLIVISLSLWGYAKSQKERVEQVVQDFERLELKRQAETTEAILAAKEANFKELIEAVNENTTRQREIELDIISVNRANDSLRDTIDRINANIDRLPEAAQAAYRDTAGNILKECSGEVIGLAGTLDKVLAERDLYYRLAGGE